MLLVLFLKRISWHFSLPVILCSQEYQISCWCSCWSCNIYIYFLTALNVLHFLFKSVFFMQPLTFCFICCNGIIFDGNWVQASLSDIPQICFSHIEKNCLEIILFTCLQTHIVFFLWLSKWIFYVAIGEMITCVHCNCIRKSLFDNFLFHRKVNSTQVCNDMRGSKYTLKNKDPKKGSSQWCHRRTIFGSSKVLKRTISFFFTFL